MTGAEVDILNKFYGSNELRSSISRRLLWVECGNKLSILSKQKQRLRIDESVKEG